jgi:hypothetical protein
LYDTQKSKRIYRTDITIPLISKRVRTQSSRGQKKEKMMMMMMMMVMMKIEEEEEKRRRTD